MGYFMKFLVTVLVAVVIHRVSKLVNASGFYKPLFNHTPGPCHKVKGVVNGSEDIVTLTTGISLITSGYSFFLFDKEEGVKGQVFTFDLNNPAAGARVLTIEGDLNRETFNPLGLSAYEENPKGKVTVFITNRGNEGVSATVEVFDFKQDKNILTHKKTIKDSNIYTPNNIVATSPDTFYLTNDGYSDRVPIRLVELLLFLPSGSVVYYDGKEARQVAGSLTFPNGVALSHTRKYLYVSSLINECLDVYIIQDDASLISVKCIHLATALDNLTVDPDTGELWVAGQFNLAIMLSQEGRARGSGHVLRIELDKDLNAEIHEVLMDDGRLVRGSSVASLYKRHLLVGTVMGELLFCQVLAF